MKIKAISKNPKIIASLVLVLILAIFATWWLLKTDNSTNYASVNEDYQSVESDKQENSNVDIEQEETVTATNDKLVEQPKIVEKTENNSSKWPVLLTSSQALSLEVVVNKKYKLPSDYIPSLSNVGSGRLRSEAAAAYNSLISGANNSGVNLKFLSGYRSYSYQEQLYNNYVARDGQTAADTYSARPGHSEHQTGLAVDVGDGGGCDLEACFGNTVAGKWVAANAYKYGFVLRYPNNKESITGYTYEPWHLRYIGKNVAAKLNDSGKTLEEYYSVEGGGY